jgi:aspartyl-tRNA(Asn)/glutamyl-tRNA(Gln) amidotransferase subunit A
MNATIGFDTAAARAQPHADTGPLAGIPLAVKDNIAVRGLGLTCGSRILDGYRSPFDATAIQHLRDAGASIVAKTNLDEFAMGSSTEHSAFGPVRHPIDPTRVPGGSSGGSAAIVASGAVPAALGSETGGSVRQPAAFCGVVGVKPTYGRVSRYGLVAFGSSLDQIGICADSVSRAGRVLHVISGRDPRDPSTADRDPFVPAAAATSLKGVCIGLPQEYLTDDLDAAVRAGVDRAVARLRDLGATIRDVSLPHTHLAIPTYYVIAPAEASSNLARFDGVRYGLRVDGPDVSGMYRASRGAGFGPEVQRRILIGTYVLSSGYYDAYYRKALIARARIAEDFDRVFGDGVDLLFTPTTPTTAFALGARTADPVQMYLADVFTAPVNLAGVPALSLPIGRAEGLPVGGQFIAAAFDEERLFAVAEALERVVTAAEEVR